MTGRTSSVSLVLRLAGLATLALAGVTCRDSSPLGPGLPGTASLAIAPTMQRAAAAGGPTFTSIRRARGVLTPVGGGTPYTSDAAFVGDSATLSFDVTFPGASQRYSLAISAIDTAGDTLFQSLREVTARPGDNQLVDDTLKYVAPDTAVRFLSLMVSDTVLLGGDSVRIVAQGYGAREQQVSPLRLGWSSRDTNSAQVAARSSSTAAVFGGGIEGDVWIVARAFNGTVDSVLVPVHLKVAALLLAADTVRLAAGESIQLAASVLAPSGAPLPNRDVTWTSLDSTIALVSPISLLPRTAPQRVAAVATNLASVVGVRPGTTAIVASTGGRSDTSVVVVNPVPVALVTVIPDTIVLLAGGRTRLSAETRDSRLNVLTGRVVTWSSADTLVARVDADGIVTALAPGLIAIRATSEGVVGTASLRVDAAAAVIASTVVSPATVALHSLGEVAQLSARSYQPDGSLAPGSYSWRVATSGIGVVSVDTLGRLTALSVGSAYVVATELGGTSDSASVVVTQLPFTVILDKAMTLDALGLTATFHATVVDSLGSTIPSEAFSWSVDNPLVATVVYAGGDSAVVSGDANGSTRVVASSAGLSGATTLVVSQRPASIVVSPASLRLGTDGRAQVHAAVFDGNGVAMTVRPGDLRWGVEGSGGTIEVNDSGEVHARRVGTGGVFAVVGGLQSKSIAIDISDNNPLALMFASDTLTMGDSVRISVFLSAARALPVTVVVADTGKLVRLGLDTLIIEAGLARKDVMVYAAGTGSTQLTATDIAKLFAPATMSLQVGKLVKSPPRAPRAAQITRKTERKP